MCFPRAKESSETGYTIILEEKTRILEEANILEKNPQDTSREFLCEEKRIKLL